MKFDIQAEAKLRAKAPHELFLTNMVGNHILWFVAALGIFNTYWQPILLVPVVSVATIIYTLIRARKSRETDDWFVMCHWQLAARRSQVFAMVLTIGFVIAALGWVAYSWLGLMKVAVIAMVGGIGLLPVMVSVLVLIVMESDAMHQAASGQLSESIWRRFPNEAVTIIEEAVSENPPQTPEPETDNAKAC